MKIKDNIVIILSLSGLAIMLIIFGPFILIYILAGIFCKLIMSPFDYIKYKNSHYQKDFPHKYSWWKSPHADSETYEAIKQNNLPVEYIKWSNDYEIEGYFVYKDILLDFTESFFFDKKKGAWLMWHANNADDGQDDYDADRENEENFLTVDEAKAYILEKFHENVPERECKGVVIFYSRTHIKERYKKGALEKMSELENFIIYEKKELASVIKNFVETR